MCKQVTECRRATVAVWIRAEAQPATRVSNFGLALIQIAAPDTLVIQRSAATKNLQLLFIMSVFDNSSLRSSG
jgi:hypothetical protein